MSLYDKLSKEDLEKISEYYFKYGIINHKIIEPGGYDKDPKTAPVLANRQLFIPVKDFLQNWSTCKETLYHALGDQFIYKIPYEAEKPESQIQAEIVDIVIDTRDENGDYARQKLNKIIERSPQLEFNDYYNITSYMFNSEVLMNNVLPQAIKITDNLTGKKKSISGGTKVFRTLSKILKIYGATQEEMDFFEDLRIKMSMILNDRYLHGNLCFSIHPLDFMTMSDNNSNWRSCMSWKGNGCYRVGSYEMMNSNNIICCYLESDKSYMGLKRNNIDAEESHFWNDKKWRMLLLTTKDIIITGKSYPYKNENLAKDCLNTVKDLVKKNLGWTYIYDVEPYKDMTKIEDLSEATIENDLERAAEKSRENGKPMLPEEVGKIYITNNGMYNDMLADNTYGYWCVRNPRVGYKVVNMSGPVCCISCGKPLLSYSEEYEPGYDEWTDRYENTEDFICEDCRAEKKCGYCGNVHLSEDLVHIVESQMVNDGNGVYTVEPSDTEVIRCRECIDNYYICPCCGRPFSLPDIDMNSYFMGRYAAAFYIKDKNELKKHLFTSSTFNNLIARNDRIFGTNFAAEDKSKFNMSERLAIKKLKDNSLYFNDIMPTEDDVIYDCDKAVENAFNNRILGDDDLRKVEYLFMCDACANAIRDTDYASEFKGPDPVFRYGFFFKRYSTYWNGNGITGTRQLVVKPGIKEKDIEKYFYRNLKKLEV